MKFVLIAAAIPVLAGPFIADYRWRQWMAARRRGRDHSNRESRR
jgi:hypothetical protein